MTDRITKIVLRGDISDFQAKMVAAGKSVSAATDRMTSAEKQSIKFRKGLTSVGDAAGKMGLVAAAGVGAILATAANFDSSMSKVQAATHDSAAEMEKLRAAAIVAGRDTVFSATEAADAITAMSKAGVSTNDILKGGLNGALSLASAGELDVANAAGIAATAMNQFGLQGKDIPHIADLLAAGAGKAQGEVTDMATALKYVGPVAHQMGISIEQTTGTITELASQGILADQAGTSLRGMLTSLTSPSRLAAKEMQTLGINLYNAQGNFVGFNGVAEQLHTSMSKLTNAERDQALGRIFGNNQVTAARILYAGGAAAVDKWTKAVNDNGYAAETAATKMNNLKGDLMNLQGSLETAFIGAGEGSQGPLRSMVEGLTGLVNGFNKLSPAAQSSATALLGITAATGGGLWFTAKAISGVSNMRQALDNLGRSGQIASAALKGLGVGTGVIAGLAILTTAATALGDSMMRSYPGVQEMTKQLIKLKQVGASKSLSADFKDIADSIHHIVDPGVGEKIGNAFSGVVTLGMSQSYELRSSHKQVDALDTAFANLVQTVGASQAQSAFTRFAGQQHLSGVQTKQLLSIMPQYKEALAGAANSATAAADATGKGTGATDANTKSVDANTKAIIANVKALEKKRQQAIAAIDKEVAYQQAIDDATKEAAHGAKTLDANTQAGRDNLSALTNLAGAWNDLTDKQKNAKGAYQDSRQQLIRVAEQMGATQKQAKHYADTLLDLPPRVETRIALHTAQAEADLKKFNQEFHGFDGDTITNKVKVKFEQLGLTGTGYGAPGAYPKPVKKASGGYIAGPGTATSDSVPALLSNGEFVVNAAATRANRGLLEQINSSTLAQQMRAQSTGRYATGGMVAGGPAIDYDRLAAAMSNARPLYGDVHMQPHNYSRFRSEMEADHRSAALGGANFA